MYFRQLFGGHGVVKSLLVGFFVGVQFSAAALAIDESSDAFSERDLQEYLAGEPVQVARSVTQSGSNPSSSIIQEKSRVAASLDSELTQLLRQIDTELNRSLISNLLDSENRAISGKLFQQYENFLALHSLYQARFKKAESKLLVLEKSQPYQQKLHEQRRRYLEQVAPFISAMSAVSRGSERKEHGVPLDDPEARLPIQPESLNLVALKTAVTALLDLTGPRTKPILRAQNLPVRGSRLTPVLPDISAPITPSYASSASPAPTLEDTSTDSEVVFAEVIRNQAKALDYDPIRIYQFVHNEVRTELYAGAMKGAEYTLLQGSGNSVDQSSLLIALLRASGIPARYVRGVVELSAESLQAQTGISDPNLIARALQQAGIGSKSVIRGGRVAAFQVDHTWVSALIPYANYRGAVVDISGQSWLPLMPAIKRHTMVAPGKILSDAGTDLAGLHSRFISTPQSDSPLDLLRSELRSYLDSSAAGQTLEQHLGSEAVVHEKGDYVPNSLPVPVLAVVEESATLADSRKHWIKFIVRREGSATSQIILERDLPLSQVASRRVTLSYLPGSIDSQNVVNQFGGLGQVPAYLIDLRPQIKIEGATVAVGSETLAMGEYHLLEVVSQGPGYSNQLAKSVVSGSYHALAVSAQSVFNDGDDKENPADTEYTAARILSQMGLRYLDAWHKSDDQLARLSRLAVLQAQPSLVFVSSQVAIDRVLDQPQQLNWLGVELDAAMHPVDVIARGAGAGTEVDYRRYSALQGSYLEHALLESDFGVGAVSADKLVAAAAGAGQIIHTITSANFPQIVPQLNHDAAVIEDLRGWVEQGFTVRIPASVVNLAAWSGSAWIVEDPATGESGYFLSGGLAGGASSILPNQWPPELLSPLIAPYVGYSNKDPLSGSSVHILAATDNQIGEVNTESDPLTVVVLDDAGLRVQGATVTFVVTQGGGHFGANSDQQTITAVTDEQGVASATLTYPQSTENYRLFLQLENDDAFATQVGGVHVDVFVTTTAGSIRPLVPFTLYARPGPVARLYNSQSGLSNLVSSSGAEGSIASSVSIVAQDQYGNPVSNVPVTVSASGATAIGTVPGTGAPNSIVDPGRVVGPDQRAACSERFTNYACGAESTTFFSSPYGTSVTPLMGRSTAGVSGSTATPLASYQFQASSAGATQTLTYQVGAPLLEFIYLYNGTKNGRQNIANVGQTYQGAIPVKVSWNANAISQPEVNFTPYAGNVPVGESAPVILGITRTSPTALEYDISLRTSSAPIVNRINVAATYSYLEPHTPPTGQASTTLGDVLGIDLTLDQITPIKAESTGGILQSHPVTFQYAPTPFEPTERSLEITQNGLPYLTAPAQVDPATGTGLAIIPRGVGFDFEQEYKASIRFNSGSLSSAGEANSDEQILEFDAPLIAYHEGSVYAPGNMAASALRYVRNSIRGEVTIDLANDKVCKGEAVLRFYLTKEAKVTFELRDYEDPDFVWHTVVSDETFSKGQNSIPIVNFPFNLREYRYSLKAVPTSDPSKVEEQFGKAYFNKNFINPLPIGHANFDNIDLFDGSLFLSRPDISLPGRGMPISLVRGYSSSTSKLKSLGLAWSHNYESKVVDSGCFGLTVVGGAGGGQTFVWDEASSSFKPQKGYHGSLRSSPDGYDFYSKDGTRYHYKNFNFGLPNEWYLESITDTNGNVTSLAYDITGGVYHKVTTVESGPHRLNFVYTHLDTADGTGPVVDYAYACEPGTSCDPAASLSNVLARVDYSYDDMGRLTKAEYTGMPSSGVDNSLVTRAEQYEYKLADRNAYYDAEGSFIADIEVERASIARIIDYRGNAIAYNSKIFSVFATPGVIGNVIKIASYDRITKPEDGTSEITIVGTDAPNRFDPGFYIQTTVRDPRGNNTVYLHNSYGAPVQVNTPVGTSYMNWDTTTDVLLKDKTDENNVKTIYEYDANGNKIREYIDGVAGSEMSYTYFGAHNPSPDFDATLIKNRLATTTDRNGKVTRYGYDARGNLTQITHPEVTRLAANLPTHLKAPPKGTFTEVFTYDRNGDRLSAKDRNGHITHYAYDRFGQINKMTQVAGERVHENYITWNAQGLKIAERDARSSDQHDTRYLTRYAYDGLRNLRLITYPSTAEGVATKSFTYDANGNKLTETDEEQKTTRWEYDKQNRVIFETDALQKTRAFTYDGAGNLKTESGFRPGTLTTYTYNDGNQQTKVEGPEDRVLNRTFDGVGNIRTEYVTSGRVTEYFYDEFNRKEKVIFPNDDDPAGNIVEYRYDPNGNLTQEIGAEPGRVTEFVYDELNRLVEQREPLGRTLGFAYDANGNTLYQVDGKGGVLTRKYDALNRVIEEKDPEQNAPTFSTSAAFATSVPRTLHYDKAGNLEREVNRRNFVTSHTYDARNRRLSTSIQAQVEGVQQTLATHYTYNKVGKLRTESLPNGNVVETLYTDLHQIYRRFDLLGDLVTNTYDEDRNLKTSKDGNGHTTEFFYDNLNRLTRTVLPDQRETEVQYDVYGNVKSREDARNNITTYEYNAVNQLVRTIDPAPFSSQVLIHEYDKAGNKTADIDRRGNKTTYGYDALNRLTTVTYPELGEEGIALTESFGYDLNNNRNSATDRRGIVTTTQYNFNNQVTRVVRDGIAIVKNRTYDPENNLILQTDAEDNITAYGYDPRNLLVREARPEAAITLHQYDTLGNRVKTTSPEGRVTRQTHDLRGRLEYSYLPKSSGTGEDVTSFAYDGADNLTGKQLPEGGEWIYHYDTTNRLERIEVNGTDLAIYAYDANNNPETQTDGENNTTTFHYDELNRRTQIDYPDSQVVTYDEYDENSNLKAMTDANGLEVSYLYDKINRETERSFALGVTTLAEQVERVATTYDNNNNVKTVTEHYFTTALPNRVYTWVYDRFDRVDRYTDAFGKVLAYQYDKNGNRTRLTDADSKVTHYSYDDLNRIATVTNNNGTTSYGYYKDSRLKQVLYPNAIAAHHQYDNAGRVKTIENRQNSAPVSRYDYLYDGNGNRVQQTEVNGGTGETTLYVYDDFDRLENVHYGVHGCPADPAILCGLSGAALNVTYTYDDAFNRSGEQHVDGTGTTILDRTYTINTRNQIDNIVDNLNAALNIDYTYDANGNQLSKIQNAEVTEFVWDNRDHLRKVMQDGSAAGQFRYDAQGLRTEKIGDRGLERYTYDDQSVLLQTDAAGTTLAKYDYGPDRLLSLTHVAEGIQFYLTDALNSVVNLANANGNIQARYQYDAWGNKRNQVGNSWNRFAFTGYEEDTESGLLYAKARFYDPDTGRFLSHDAWEGDTMMPPSLHKYLYAYQNPTVFIDIDGNESIPLFSAPIDDTTLQIPTFDQVYDFGHGEIVDHLASTPGSLLNIPISMANAVLAGANAPLKTASVLSGKSQEELSNEAVALIASSGPAAPIVLAGEIPLMPGMALNRLSHMLKGAKAIESSHDVLEQTTTLSRSNVFDEIPEVKIVVESPSGLLPRIIPPRGFQSVEQFQESMQELNDIVRSHGISDAKFRIRGSSTTGFSQNPYKEGKFFDDDGPSDIDLGIDSDQLAKRLTEAGEKPSTTVPGLFLPGKIERAVPKLSDDLLSWQEKWSKELGREIEPAVNDPNLLQHSDTDVIYRP